MIAFVIFNGLSALVNDYYTMMVVRFLLRTSTRGFFGVGTVVATRLAKPGKQAQSIAMMFTGLTLANLAMVPFVTWLGHQLSWRYAFGVVSVLGLLTLISLNSFCLIWTACAQQHSETSWSFQICKSLAHHRNYRNRVWRFVCVVQLYHTFDDQCFQIQKRILSLTLWF
jgi:predicted MFS family arabinose efflux permease